MSGIYTYSTKKVVERIIETKVISRNDNSKKNDTLNDVVQLEIAKKLLSDVNKVDGKINER